MLYLALASAVPEQQCDGGDPAWETPKGAVVVEEFVSEVEEADMLGSLSWDDGDDGGGGGMKHRQVTITTEPVLKSKTFVCLHHTLADSCLEGKWIGLSSNLH